SIAATSIGPSTSDVYTQPPATGGMIATSSPAARIRLGFAYRSLTATNGWEGNRSAPGSARTCPRTSPTVAPGDTSSESECAPNESAYEAKRSTVTVMTKD